MKHKDGDDYKIKLVEYRKRSFILIGALAVLVFIAFKFPELYEGVIGILLALIGIVTIVLMKYEYNKFKQATTRYVNNTDC